MAGRQDLDAVRARGPRSQSVIDGDPTQGLWWPPGLRSKNWQGIPIVAIRAVADVQGMERGRAGDGESAEMGVGGDGEMGGRGRRQID